MATIRNDRDYILQTSPYRLADTSVDITGTAGAFITGKNGGATIPSSITLTATASGVFTTSSVKTWHYSLNITPDTWVPLGTGATQTISSSTILAIMGNATEINYRCTVTEPLLNTAFAFFKVGYSKQVSDPLVVDISRTNAVISCTELGVPLNYDNTGTVIKVTRGAVLNYSSIPGIPNTFTVYSPTLTSGLVIGNTITTATSYGIGNITGVTEVASTATFVITLYNDIGIAEVPSITRQITYTKVNRGDKASVYYIESSSPVITKSSSAYNIAGIHSNITVVGKRVTGNGDPEIAGFLTITPNGVIEAETALIGPSTTGISDQAGKVFYTVRLYSGPSALTSTLLDTEVIPVVFTGSSAITTSLSNDSVTIPTNTLGTAYPGSYTHAGTRIDTYEGSTLLIYDAEGVNNGTWRVVITDQISITAGIITDGGQYAVVNPPSDMTDGIASIRYVIIGKTLSGKDFYTIKVQTFSKAVQGIQGIPGTKSITISAFKWGSSPGFVQEFTYTWFGGVVSVYPEGWSASAPASTPTTTGLALYQLNLTITDSATATQTTANWNDAVVSTIGYRQDGTVGPQGDSHRTAYTVTTSSTPPTGVASALGDLPPVSTGILSGSGEAAIGKWSFTPKPVLAEGEFMYQVDGILGLNGNITWSLAYLSNLKVGNLSAISANLGTVSISNVGALYSVGKSYYGNSTAGFFLGYASDAYKLDIGNGSNYLRWSGTDLTISGIINGSTINSTTINSGDIAIQGGTGGGAGWGYVRSVGKLWNDTNNGWVLARGNITEVYPEGNTYFDCKAGANRIWMSSWNECGITFPKFNVNSSGDAYFAGTLAANIVTANTVVAKNITHVETVVRLAENGANTSDIVVEMAFAGTLTISLIVRYGFSIPFTSSTRYAIAYLYKSLSQVDTRVLGYIDAQPPAEHTLLYSADVAAGTHTFQGSASVGGCTSAGPHRFVFTISRNYR